MRDENTFATAYRSDLRDEIVETLKDYADGITVFVLARKPRHLQCRG